MNNWKERENREYLFLGAKSMFLGNSTILCTALHRFVVVFLFFEIQPIRRKIEKYSFLIG
jgi:hypothetical protein